MRVPKVNPRARLKKLSTKYVSPSQYVDVEYLLSVPALLMDTLEDGLLGMEPPWDESAPGERNSPEKLPRDATCGELFPAARDSLRAWTSISRLRARTTR